MITGILQRRWQAEQPAVYDKETRIVCLDITPEVQKDADGNDQNGYSFIPVEIDSQIDYGHIKSQLIEAGFAQKDEFGLLMNTVDSLIELLQVQAVGPSSRKHSTTRLSTSSVSSVHSEICAQRPLTK